MDFSTNPLPHLLAARVGAVQESVRRARTALLAGVLASLAVFTCVWNAYVSWDRHLVRLDAGREYQAREELKKEALAQCRGESKCGEDLAAAFFAYRQAMFEHKIRMWTETHFVAINLLGIRVSVNDFPFLGAAGLLFICYYMTLTSRRMNRDVAHLLCDHAVLREPWLNRMVFMTVNTAFVFSLNRGDDTPIAKLDEVTPGRQSRGLRRLAMGLYWAPLTTGAFMLAADLLATFRTAGHFASLYRFPQGIPRSQALESLHVGSLVFCVCCLWFMAWLTIQGLRYATATRSLLDEFRERFGAATVPAAPGVTTVERVI